MLWVGRTVPQPFPLAMPVTTSIHQPEIQKIVTADKIQLTYKIHIQFSISIPLRGTSIAWSLFCSIFYFFVLNYFHRLHEAMSRDAVTQSTHALYSRSSSRASQLYAWRPRRYYAFKLTELTEKVELVDKYPRLAWDGVSERRRNRYNNILLFIFIMEYYYIFHFFAS
jgi:hypothetical protein